MDTSLELAGITFGNALMNGAFIGSKTLADIKALAQSDCGAIVVGSISVKPRIANPGPGYWMHKERIYSLNSYGLPNGGVPYFKGTLPRMVKLAHEHNKPLIANVVGFSKEEFAELILLAQNAGADMVELNFGCPNVWDNGEQKQIISYHASLVRDTLEFIRANHFSIKLILKISPLPPDILREVAGVIIDSGAIHAITATNSYPNGVTSSDTTPASPPVLAGITGTALKPISLGVVKQLVALLPKDFPIIGCGGIGSADDVADYLLAGAKAVQLATSLVEDGPLIFEKILQQTART